MELTLRAVIVEDVAIEAELAVRELRKTGIYLHTRIVQDEASLRVALDAFEPDIVLSDFTLPQFDGMRALSIVREVSADIPFIFVSGTIGEERAIEALKRGASDYVLKSNLERLPQAVRQAVEHRRLEYERRQAEALREASENKLRNIVNTIKEWIWEADADGVINFSSNFVEALLGVSSQNILGTSVLDRIHADDRPSFLNALKLWNADTPGQGIVHRWMHTDRSVIWVESSASLLTDEEGRLTGYRVASRDVSDRKRHEDMLARVSRAHELASKTNAAIIRIRNRRELLQEICSIAIEAANYDMARIRLLNEQKDALHLVAKAGIGARVFDVPDLPIREDTPAGAGMHGTAVRDREIVVCNDLVARGSHVYLRDHLIEAGFRSMVALPFLVKNEVVGVLTLGSFQADIFHGDEMNILRNLVSDICYALEHLENEERLNYVAFYDSLTALAKHELFRERLAQTLNISVGYDEKVLVVVWDIENLSDINNTCGRQVGDKLLQRIAERLRSSSIGERNISHFGGGKFAAMLTLYDERTDIQNFVSDKEAEFLHGAYLIDGNELRLSARSGVSMAPNDAADSDGLISNAEAALSSAKFLREHTVVYTPRIMSRANERLSLEARLHKALEQQQFRLHYQPKIRTVDGGICGLEALLRWMDPELGLVPPGKFIAALEHSGMIVNVGRWVVDQVIRDAAEWRGKGLPPLHIAVNVSSAELHRGDFLNWLLKTVVPDMGDDWGIDLEITESMLMQDVDSNIRKMNAVRDAGIRVAIDDFGTGYSSLSYLAKLPVDMLKIDRSFVSGIASSAENLQIISTILSLAETLHLTTIAEGVETADQFRLLKQMHCDELQGYLFGQPLPSSDMTGFLRRGNYPLPFAP